jgi:hypothetical protein
MSTNGNPTYNVEYYNKKGRKANIPSIGNTYFFRISDKGGRVRYMGERNKDKDRLLYGDSEVELLDDGLKQLKGSTYANLKKIEFANNDNTLYVDSSMFAEQHSSWGNYQTAEFYIDEEATAEDREIGRSIRKKNRTWWDLLSSGNSRQQLLDDRTLLPQIGSLFAGKRKNKNKSKRRKSRRNRRSTCRK